MSLSIPAWKRLGLKLKYAKDQPDVAENPGVERISTRPASVIGIHDDGRPHKRQRMSKTSGVETNYSQNPDQTRISPTIIEPVNGHRSTTSATVHRTPTRQKSVTFSTDTKDLDGDSRITIDFPAGSPGSTPYKAKQSRDTVELSSAGENDASQDAPEAEPVKSKKKKKESSAKKLKGRHTDIKGKTDSALPYLDQHRHNKDSWKFNKNRDVWIVNHSLDTNAIPSSHVLALAGYVKGLPTKAAARQRLIQQCRLGSAGTKPQNHRTGEEKMRFLALLEDVQISSESQGDFLDSIPRPVQLLWALGEDVESANSSVTAGLPSTISKTLVERKKKSRTAGPVDISSSESDSDSESSDTDSESDEESGTTASNGVKINGVVDDTSSSGTDSSSSSDSDNSSEGDSDEASD